MSQYASLSILPSSHPADQSLGQELYVFTIVHVAMRLAHCWAPQVNIFVGIKGNVCRLLVVVPSLQWRDNSARQLPAFVVPSWWRCHICGIDIGEGRPDPYALPSLRALSVCSGARLMGKLSL